MNEAIAELRAEGLQVAGLGAAEQDVVEQMHYVDDAHIEIEVEAGLPDAYVAQQAERLKLYRELDSTKDEAALQAFESRLADRFGPLPREAQELLLSLIHISSGGAATRCPSAGKQPHRG